MADNKPLKVLIIEDNEQMSEMIKDSIIQKFTNAKVSVFNSGETALEQTKSEPDLIICDYQLDSQNSKALNGIQVLGKLKKQFNAPVVFLSAQEKPEVSANIIKYGAYDYVVKNQQSFQRIEIIINNILNSRSQKVNSKSQKTIINLLIGVIILLLGVIVAMVIMN
jgi:DNA-binding NarL/FixJ family response regulator